MASAKSESGAQNCTALQRPFKRCPQLYVSIVNAAVCMLKTFLYAVR